MVLVARGESERTRRTTGKHGSRLGMREKYGKVWE